MSVRTVSPAVYRRRRAVALLGLVLLLTLVLAFAWPGFARSGPAGAGPATPSAPLDPVGASTSAPATDPAATSTSAAPLVPVARTTGTAFAKALPSRVLGFVLTEETGADGWTVSGALEAYTLEYADGSGEGARVVTVTAGQYPTSDAARDAADALVTAAGERRGGGAVLVDGDTAGRYVVTGGTATGSETVTWYNGTAVLQVTGPTAVVEDVYAAYPL